MTTRTHRKNRRPHDRGAIAVEFAIAATLLVTLFFGVLEVGVALKSRAMITDASGEGARVAAAQPRTSGFQNQTLAAIQGVVNANKVKSIDYVVIYRADPATGLHYKGEGIETCFDSCWRFELIDGAFAQKLGAAWDHNKIAACGDIDDTDWLGVYVRGHHTPITGFIGGTRRFTDTTIMRFEPMPPGVRCR